MNDTNLLENHSQQVLNHLTRSLSDSDLYRFETTNSLPTMNSKSPSVISWPIVNDIEEWFNFNPPSYDHIFFDPIRSTQSLLIEDLKRLIRQQQEQSSTKIKEMTVKNFELEKKLEDLIERNALSIKEINLIHEELEHIKSITSTFRHRGLIRSYGIQIRLNHDRTIHKMVKDALTFKRDSLEKLWKQFSGNHGNPI
ncbi:hypothetical protein NH340_JMT08147 [Sarcoptes scabiei]|nr:hypothetical protein NH340_JMT08147 [Sarcoptes scabiei]